MVEEKIFSALPERKKARDFYDLYFIMRRGLLSVNHKKYLAKIKHEIITDARKIDFRRELGVFLPMNQQAIVRDFAGVLERELNRQITGL